MTCVTLPPLSGTPRKGQSPASPHVGLFCFFDSSIIGPLLKLHLYLNYRSFATETTARGRSKPTGQSQNTPDNINLRNRSSYLAPIAQILARLEIHNQITKQELPKEE